MERIPILKMGDFLLVTIQVDMHDQLALALQDDLPQKISHTGARGELIDISAVEVVQPAVAITLVELGLTLPGVRTALNVERGMALLLAEVGSPSRSLIGEAQGDGQG